VDLEQANFLVHMAQDVLQNLMAKRPPLLVLILAAVGLSVGAVGAGMFLYNVIQTSLMAGGDMYKPRLPEIQPVNVKNAPQCDPKIEKRWVMCF